MEANGGVVFLLLLSLFLLSNAELESSSKKRGDITQKSNSNEETEEEVAIEDMENAFEQLRELSALRDTILKLVPASDPIYEKIGKQSTGRKEDGEGKTETTSKETLESPGTRNVWMKTMIAQTKDSDSLVINERSLDEDDMESWEAQELYETLEEEVQEPLSMEQQAGMSVKHALFSLNGIMTSHLLFLYFYSYIFFSRAVVQESRKYHKCDARQQARRL